MAITGRVSIIYMFISVISTQHLQVGADVSISPLWNATVVENGSKTCSLTTRNINGEMMTALTSNGDQICSVQIATSMETATIMIEIPEDTPLDTFVYVEKQGDLMDCLSRYVVISTEGPCSTVFSHTNLQLFLQGNTSVLIGGTPVSQTLSLCPEMNPNNEDSVESGVNQCRLEHFNNTLSCSTYSNQTCSFEVPSYCTATLGYGKIYLNCSQSEFFSSYTALTIYPDDIMELDFSGGNVVEISEYALMNLKKLRELDLSYMILGKLYTQTFVGLRMLTNLELSGNQLHTLNRGTFDWLPNLKILFLDDNQIGSLHVDLFQELINLVDLSIMNNDLISLQRGLFDELIHLESLHLYHNRISSVDVDSFSKSNSLTVLDLDWNNLRVLQKGIFNGLGSLENLYISENQISSIDNGLFSKTESLKILALDRNKLTSLSNGLFNRLNNLQTLYLYENQITSVDEGVFAGLTNLTYLSLWSNNLTVISKESFEELNDLETLDLYCNQISSIDANAFTKTTKLWYLSLSRNQLTILPRGVFKGLVNLETLGLYNNKISSVEKDLFNETANLISLDMSENRLSVLPRGLFKGLNKLNKLVLFDNQINVVDKDLFNETKALTLLRLGWNNLTNVPTRLFSGLSNLEIIGLNSNQISYIDDTLFNETKKLVELGLGKNNLLLLPNQLWRGMNNLQYLGLQRTCHVDTIQSVERTWFQDMPYLEILLLEGNGIVEIPYDSFWGLKSLNILDLYMNYISFLNYTVFKGLQNLEILYLDYNQFRVLDSRLFNDTVNLRLLELSGNQLTKIPDITGLKHLSLFGIRENVLTMIDKSTFRGISQHLALTVSQTEICECYIPAGNDCAAIDVRSPYLTCDRLLSDRVLMVMMWVIGINALGGNIFVLIQQKKTKTEKNAVQTFMLSNLAISDMLMGIYMLIIASADIYFGNHFPMQSEAWRTDITCKIAGAISIISSEASVFFVALISIDRFINIRFPFSQHKLRRKSSAIVVALLWLIALALGITPSALAGQNYKFYDNSHVCIGLPLAQIERFTKEVLYEYIDLGPITYEEVTVESESLGYVPGLYYASALFLGLNGISYFVILLCYVEIVRVAFRSSKRAGLSKDMKDQMRITIKVAAIVLTDFFCWSPIIVLGILVQSKILILPSSVFAWCVTVILPINSAINPYLYTIAGIISDRRKAQNVPSEIKRKKVTATGDSNLPSLTKVQEGDENKQLPNTSIDMSKSNV